MLNTLKKIIDSAALAGVAINVTSKSDSELAIVFTPKLAALSKSGKSDILEDGKANAESHFNLRAALSTPWVMTGTPESIETQLNDFLHSAGTPLEQANSNMNNSSFIDALNNATKAVEANKAPAPKANKKNNPDTTPAATTTPATKVVESAPVQTPVETQEPPAVDLDLFNDFDDIDSI
ncbi:hypothetical protein [Pseudoalteromonas sp. MelDa3]|uniref:hypothetical protein n=1 Tax=Pseudoalteromonas sp. MelDa3 TaxID=888435 RepID=UPI000CBE43AF|nr:hypothetical protein [Pseudoalteromonas sp. MelDa3]PLT25112.1 hypothetical protein CXF89_12245 [Pseudoalteromonas sp. MelDa3]